MLQLAFASAVLLAGHACSTVATPMPDLAEEINSTLRLDPFVVREGDVLEVRFLKKSEWNFSTRVRQDGRGSFTGLDELEVAGKTLREVDEMLTGLYARLPEKPEVTVDYATISEDTAVNPRGVMVIGEVVTPGSIVLRGERISLVEAIARAGGFDKRTANLGNTLLVRWLPDQNRRVAWRLDASVEHWGAPVPVLLQPNDIVFVPNTSIDDVNIWVDQYIRLMIPIGLAIPIPVGN
jgi:protein involved in polysaccharide export with SLBB domain